MGEVSHDAGDPAGVRVLLVTVSDTRTLDDDPSGTWLAQALADAGHTVVERRLVPDDPGVLGALLDRGLPASGAEVALLCGGTGISARDGTYEVVVARLEKRLEGFGELFRMLSWEQVGPRAMLSRAVAGLIGRRAVFALPGSLPAVQLAAERLVLPILPHLVGQARR